MDQIKVFLRQCVKYRFWIAVGVSMLLPMIGYFAGAGAYTEATTKREADIKATSTDVSKYDTPGPANADYKKLVDEKKEVLSKDVNATQRKLYDRQEPLLKWPEVVESKFRGWGRKWPENTDLGQVQAVIRDYTVAYPAFVTKVYQTFKPWNPEDGTGIVFAPDEATLLKPAAFTLEAPPTLGKVWSEQERLWVLTAIFDVISRVNADAGAKDWDGSWIKQIVSVDVGSPLAQDQQSIAKGVALEPGPALAPEGAAPVEEAPAAEGMAGMMGMMGMKGGGPGGSNGEVYYLKPETAGPYKILPVEITVMIDQNRLAEFMVALENSPMAIQVMEPEISKPATAIVKPVKGEMSYAMGGMEMMGGMGGMAEMMGGMQGRGMQGRGMGRMGNMGAGGMGGMSEMMGGMGMMGGMQGRGMSGMGGAPKRQGTDQRGVNKAEERKKKAAEATKSGSAPKKTVDQYFDVVQLTIYGQARFYDTPAPVPPPEASEGAAPAAESAATPAPAPTPNAEAAPVADPAKVEATTPPAATPAAPPAATPAATPSPAATPAPTPAPASPPTPAPGTEPTPGPKS